MWSILYQLFCVAAGTASFFFVASYNVSMSLLIFGVCASRIGLWVFDIAVTQLMQEFVPEGIRGVVGGTQHAMNAFFQLSAFCLGFVFPSPKEYDILAFTGCISVLIAAAIYSTSVFLRKEMFVTERESK
jgi:solute carrier family 40 (iron-regulated transporter), member 1